MTRLSDFGAPCLALLLCVAPLVGCGNEGETTDPADDTNPAQATPTATATAIVTPTPTATAVVATPTATATATEVPTVAPTPIPTPPPTAAPTPTMALGPLEISKTFPDGQAWAFDPAARSFEVYFNRPFPEGFSALEDVSVVLNPVGGGAPVIGVGTSFVDGAEGVRFSVSTVPGTDYDFDVTIDSAVPAGSYSYSGSFSTKVPCGVGFDLADRPETRLLTIEEFGAARQGQIAGLNTGINSVPQDLVAIFDEVYDAEPLPLEGPNTFTVVVGSIIPISSSSGTTDTSIGFSTSLEGCSVNSAGTFFCSGDLLVVPLDTGVTGRKELASLYLRNVSVSGTVTAGTPYTFSGLTINGIVSKTDIDRFLAESGQAVEAVLSPILANENNYNSAYEGEPAMTVVITAQPVPFTLTGCNTGGPQ